MGGIVTGLGVTGTITSVTDDIEEIEEIDVLDSDDLFCLITGSGFHLGTGKSIGLLGRVLGGLLTFGDFGHEETGDISLGLVGCVGERIP